MSENISDTSHQPKPEAPVEHVLDFLIKKAAPLCFQDLQHIPEQTIRRCEFEMHYLSSMVYDFNNIPKNTLSDFPSFFDRNNRFVSAHLEVMGVPKTYTKKTSFSPPEEVPLLEPLVRHIVMDAWVKLGGDPLPPQTFFYGSFGTKKS